MRKTWSGFCGAILDEKQGNRNWEAIVFDGLMPKFTLVRQARNRRHQNLHNPAQKMLPR
jgi:hypothetical protein